MPLDRLVRALQPREHVGEPGRGGNELGVELEGAAPGVLGCLDLAHLGEQVAVVEPQRGRRVLHLHAAAKARECLLAPARGLEGGGEIDDQPEVRRLTLQQPLVGSDRAGEVAALVSGDGGFEVALEGILS